MAIGVVLADPGMTNRGLVRLYKKYGTDWNQSQQITGPAIYSGYFGFSLDLSHDGSTLAVSALYRSVYIYELSDVTSKYYLLHATADIDATDVCVSGDGSTVGISANGGARIFVRDGNAFQQRGPTLNFYGRSWSGIALSYNGTIAAIGDYSWYSYRGRMGVFQWRDDNGNGSMEWMQMGSDITGDAASDFLGRNGCVSITYDGLTVAVGAPYYDKDGLSGRGLVRVFNHDSTIDTWKQSGSDLLGDNVNDNFSKTALSSDGTYLTVGAYGSGDYVKLFTKIESNYEMIGDRVRSGQGYYFGFSVDMSADGAAVAIGDYSINSYKGRAYLLLHNVPTHTPTFVPTKIPSSVPSKSPSFTPSVVISQIPSVVPTKYPSSAPSAYPSFVPSAAITQIPSVVPTKVPSSVPSTSPSGNPSEVTTYMPTFVFTKDLSSSISLLPPSSGNGNGGM